MLRSQSEAHLPQGLQGLRDTCPGARDPEPRTVEGNTTQNLCGQGAIRENTLALALPQCRVEKPLQILTLFSWFLLWGTTCRKFPSRCESGLSMGPKTTHIKNVPSCGPSRHLSSLHYRCASHEHQSIKRTERLVAAHELHYPSPLGSDHLAHY